MLFATPASSDAQLKNMPLAVWITDALPLAVAAGSRGGRRFRRQMELIRILTAACGQRFQPNQRPCLASKVKPDEAQRLQTGSGKPNSHPLGAKISPKSGTPI